MGRCLTTDQLLALATESVSGRTAGRLERHCRRCAACRELLEEWRTNQRYADDVRRAVQGGSSIASSHLAVEEAFIKPVPMVPLMSSDAIHGYEILGEVHRGAQGVVYRAVQKSTGREVAIKVAFERMELAGKRPHRFDREVELASRLKHPSIIAIFDSGTTPDGRCYFVMDYVHGLSVDQYVRERELGLRGALELFTSICEAVNHAHQRGVIHRDLKPSNILVDAEGIPRVLDFGLAKALGGASARFSTVVSVAGQLLGTVPYMAPEQLAGRPEAADIRTDVYALGVLLYEVLAGCLPYDISLSASEMLRCITDGSPAPPSASWKPISGIEGHVAPGARHGNCPVDDELDAIVLQAMALSPDRRYQNAADLGRDVRRYLAGEPIEAKRERGLYVLRKFLHRHRLPVSIAAGFFVLLATALTAITTLYVKVEDQRSLTQAERDRAIEAQHNADERAEQLRAVMYLGHMSSAVAATEANNLGRLREELYACPADLRGWEWYWLAGQFDHSERVLRGHQANVMALGSVGAALIASASQDGTLRRWDLESMQPVGDALSLGKAHDICFAPNGETLAVWDGARRVVLQTVEGNTVARLERPGTIRRMVFSPDSSVLAVGRADGWIDLWNAATGKLLRRIGQHQACASAIAFSPDGRLLASGSWDETVRIWDVESGAQLYVFTDQHDCITAVFWSFDGGTLVSGGCSGSLMLWDVPGGKLQKVLQTKSEYISAIASSPEAHLLVTADMSRNLSFWDMQTGDACGRMTIDGSWLRSLAFTSDGEFLVGSGSDHGIRVWPISQLPYRLSIKAHKGPARAIAFGPGGRLASGGDDGTVKLWDATSGRHLNTFIGHEGRVRGVAFSPDGTWIASGGLDQTVRIWDVRTGAARRVLTGHEDGVLTVAISADGRWIASGGSDFASKGKDNSVRIWESATGREVMCLRGHAGGVPAVAFSPDGRYLVSGGRDSTGIVWDLTSGQAVTTYRGHSSTLRTVVFTPDGQHVLSAAEDNTVQTWDALTGRQVAAPLIHSKVLVGLALSPDGARRATFGNWGFVNIWPEKDINWELLKLHSGYNNIWSAAFSPDGASLACSHEGDIWIWRAITAKALERSPQAAQGLAAGALRLWGLRQRADAEQLFAEALMMHEAIFGPQDDRTVELGRQYSRFQRGDFFESPPVGGRPPTVASQPVVTTQSAELPAGSGRSHTRVPSSTAPATRKTFQ